MHTRHATTIARFLAVLGSCALLTASVARAERPAEPRHVEESFASGGATITVERYEPAAEGKYPALLLLHAIDGLAKPHGDLYRAAARRYAGKGYVVLLLHYFDRTGNAPEQVKAVREQFVHYARGGSSADEEKAVNAHFRDWMTAVADATKYARGLRNVDGGRIGVVGFSLGAYLALASAAEKDLKLSAVVDFFGGLPRPMHAKAANLPPTLILHGDADTVVPVAEAHELHSLLKKAKRPSELVVYEGAGHVFSEPGQAKGKVGLDTFLRTLKQMDDADSRTAAFVDGHLKPAPRTATVAKERSR
jgi:carboxymethylenebutenolidase